MKKILAIVLAALLIFAACNNEKKEVTENKETSATMESKQDRNKKVIMTCMENFAKGDYDATFKDMDPSYIDYTDGTIPPITNLDTLKSFFKMMTFSIEGYKAENMKYFADGDYVLVVADWGGIFKNDLMGIKATRKPIRFKDLDMFKLNEKGRIIEHSAVQNFAATLIMAGMSK